MDILSSKTDGILTIEFNRPERKNAITGAMYQSMADALVDAEQDGAVRAILIIGKPEIFTAGNDLEDFLKNAPAGDYRRQVTEGIIAARAGRKQDALAAIEQLRKDYGETVHYQVAQIYAQLGMIDEAANALEIAWSTRDSGLAAVKVDPFMDPVRKDPRYLQIVKRLFA